MPFPQIIVADGRFDKKTLKLKLPLQFNKLQSHVANLNKRDNSLRIMVIPCDLILFNFTFFICWCSLVYPKQNVVILLDHNLKKNTSPCWYS